MGGQDGVPFPFLFGSTENFKISEGRGGPIEVYDVNRAVQYSKMLKLWRPKLSREGG